MTPTDLIRIRNKAGLSVDGLAKLLRTTRFAVHRWENGQRAISGPASVLLEMLDKGYRW